jgi:predicted nucleic acid-binding protein
MKDKAFLDTNVLVYLYSVDEPLKQARATESFRKYECITSVQAFNEFCYVLLRKWKLPIETIKKAIYEIEGYCHVVIVDTDIIEKALDIHSKYSFSYYDSVMLASALASQCTLFLSEDMNDTQIIDGYLTICNIFK